jgi:CRISPR system Cascade subunit CasB
MSPEQKSPQKLKDIAADWWGALQPDPDRHRPGDRAALAQLRRCSRPEDAIEVPAALALARALGARDGHDRRLGDFLATAIVLAHVRKDDRDNRMARQLGAAVQGERALLSPLRLARLLAAQTPEERIAAFRRAVALADHKVNLRDLADAMLDWSHPVAGERIRIAWAFAYHNVPSPTGDLAAPIPSPTAGDQV